MQEFKGVPEITTHKEEEGWSTEEASRPLAFSLCSSATLLSWGEWIWRGLETQRQQQEQSPRCRPRLSQTNIRHNTREQAATSDCINVCKMHTEGTVWSLSPPDRGTAAALMPPLTHNQRADTLTPSRPVTLTSLKRISRVL